MPLKSRSQLKIGKAVFLAFVAATLFSSSSRASFQDRGWGVRAMGMGGAFTALANDASAVFWNPAGTPWLKQKQAYFMWDKAYSGLDGIDVASGFFSVIMPARYAHWGVAATSYNGNGLINENVGVFHAARRWGRLGLGLNMKVLALHQDLSSDPAAASNPLFNGKDRRNAFSVDSGIIYRPDRKISMGLSASNVNKPDMGLFMEDKVPAQFRAAVAWRGIWQTSLGADLIYRDSLSDRFENRMDLVMGGERWFSISRGSMGVRVGGGRDQLTAGLSFRTGPVGSVGYGLDYAFIAGFGFLKDALGAHKLALSIYFNPPATVYPVETEKSLKIPAPARRNPRQKKSLPKPFRKSLKNP